MNYSEFKGRRFKDRNRGHVWLDCGDGTLELMEVGGSSFTLGQLFPHDNTSKRWPEKNWEHLPEKKDLFVRIYDRLK